MFGDFDDAEQGSGAGHVLVHGFDVAGEFDVVAAGIEDHAFADKDNWGFGFFRALIVEGDEAWFAVAALVDGEDAAGFEFF